MSVPDYRSTGPAPESLPGGVFRCPQRGVNFRSEAVHFRSGGQKIQLYEINDLQSYPVHFRSPLTNRRI